MCIHGLRDCCLWLGVSFLLRLGLCQIWAEVLSTPLLTHAFSPSLYQLVYLTSYKRHFLFCNPVACCACGLKFCLRVVRCCPVVSICACEEMCVSLFESVYFPPIKHLSRCVYFLTPLWALTWPNTFGWHALIRLALADFSFHSSPFFSPSLTEQTSGFHSVFCCAQPSYSSVLSTCPLSCIHTQCIIRLLRAEIESCVAFAAGQQVGNVLLGLTSQSFLL